MFVNQWIGFVCFFNFRRLYLGDVDFSFVHEFDDDGQIIETRFAHDDDHRSRHGRFGVLQEKLFKVGAASRQHHLQWKRASMRTNNQEWVRRKRKKIRNKKKKKNGEKAKPNYRFSANNGVRERSTAPGGREGKRRGKGGGGRKKK